MPQSFTVGRVASDFRLRAGAEVNCYVRFNFIENFRVYAIMRTRFSQVRTWGEKAKQLIKGSRICLSNVPIFIEYNHQDGIATSERHRVILDKQGDTLSGRLKTPSPETMRPRKMTNYTKFR